MAALAAFFEPPWETPAASLSAAAQAFLLCDAGDRIMGHGPALIDALESLQAGLDRQVDLREWDNAATAAENLHHRIISSPRRAG